MISAQGIDEKTLKRDGVCTASLPTTMAIISGLLVQHALKILLDFGKISGCVSYNALQDFFPTYPLAPNPACSNAVCQLRQKEYQEIIAAKITTTISSTTSTAAAPTHETNEWCIELSDQDTPLTTSSSSTAAAQPLRDEASLSLSSSDSAPNFHPPKAAASPKSETSDLASLKDRLKKQFQ